MIVAFIQLLPLSVESDKAWLALEVRKE